MDAGDPLTKKDPVFREELVAGYTKRKDAIMAMEARAWLKSRRARGRSHFLLSRRSRLPIMVLPIWPYPFRIPSYFWL